MASRQAISIASSSSSPYPSLDSPFKIYQSPGRLSSSPVLLSSRASTTIDSPRTTSAAMDMMDTDTDNNMGDSAPFKNALRTFKSHLPAHHDLDFSRATLAELQAEILAIQEHQDRNRTVMNLPRIRPFLEAAQALDSALRGVLAESAVSELMAFIWGPTRWVLHVSSADDQAFDHMLEMYQMLGNEIIRIPYYDAEECLPHDSSALLTCLAHLYEDVLYMETILIAFFRRPSWPRIFQSVWQNTAPILQSIANSIKLNADFLEESLPPQDGSKSSSSSSPAGGSSSEKSFGLQPPQTEAYKAKRAALWGSHHQEEQAQRRQQRVEVQGWLCTAPATELIHAHNVQTQQAYPETGKWLLAHPEVQDWATKSNPSHPVIWLCGAPGTGKTILASKIIESCKHFCHSAEEQHSSKQDSGVSYFYCRQGDPRTTTAMGVVKGLLSHLIETQPLLLPALTYAARSSGEVTLARPDTARELLEMLLEAGGVRYIVVDGIDALDKEETRNIVQLLEGMSRKSLATAATSVRVLFTSSTSAQMRAIMSTGHAIELVPANHLDDIRAYIRHRGVGIGQKCGLNGQDLAEIEKRVTRYSQGEFLRARLIMEQLEQTTSRAEVQETLTDDLFSEARDDLYDTLLESIKERLQEESPEHAKAARLLLPWIALAKRPLLWHETRDLARRGAGQSAASPEIEQLLEDVLEVCEPILQNFDKQTVQVAHESAKECFDQPRLKYDSALFCLTYLSGDSFTTNCSDATRNAEVLQGGFALQDYIVANWSWHLQLLLKDWDPLLKDKKFEEGLNKALDVFIKTHQASFEGIPPTPASTENTPWPELSTFPFYSKLLQLRTHIINNSPLTTISLALEKNRKALEALAQTPDQTTKSPLITTLLGPNLYKCNDQACPLFSEGFTTKSARDTHQNLHERPYHCPLSGCTQAPYGFSSKKDKERHVRLYHPEQSGQPPAFVQPSRRTDDARFRCSICDKSFTRNINLKGHMSSHFGERPFSCSSCGKAFTRVNDCRRHEKIHAKKG